MYATSWRISVGPLTKTPTLAPSCSSSISENQVLFDMNSVNNSRQKNLINFLGQTSEEIGKIKIEVVLFFY